MKRRNLTEIMVSKCGFQTKELLAFLSTPGSERLKISSNNLTGLRSIVLSPSNIDVSEASDCDVVFKDLKK